MEDVRSDGLEEANMLTAGAHCRCSSPLADETRNLVALKSKVRR
jgi:hypothetical protein